MIKLNEKLTRNQRRKRDYAVSTMHGPKSRSAKRAALKLRRTARCPRREHPPENCGNPGCARCFPEFRAVKP